MTLFRRVFCQALMYSICPYLRTTLLSEFPRRIHLLFAGVFFFTDLSFFSRFLFGQTVFHLFVRRIPSFCSSTATLGVFYLLFHKHFILLRVLWGVGFLYLPMQDISVSVLGRLLVTQSGFRIPSGEDNFPFSCLHPASMTIKILLSNLRTNIYFVYMIKIIKYLKVLQHVSDHTGSIIRRPCTVLG